MNCKKSFIIFIYVMFCAFATARTPKYVFYFIGDGMGMNHVEAALIYQSQNVKDLAPGLVFTGFPVTGFSVTRSASNYITDSSAGGTALATGHKTNNNVVGMDTLDKPVCSVMEKAQKQKWMTGAITSTSIDDATPASFYAHSEKRNLSYEIGKQAATSGINFLGGAGLKSYTNKEHPNDPDLLDVFMQNGYRVYKGMNDYSRNKTIQKKVLLIPDRNYPNVCLPFAIDRQPDDMSLEQLTSSALEYFEKSGAKRFMLMVEGGQIDHAAHPNDAASVIHEVIDLSRSVQLAYEFYLKHPDETLIVLTADHETGGLGLGTVKVNLNIQNLKYQKISLSGLSALMNEIRRQKQNDVQWEDVAQLLKDKLGFWQEVEISAKDEKNLKDCFIQTFVQGDDKKVVTLYSSDEPLAVMAVEIMNRISYVGWTTTSHSAAPVPVFAIGAGAEQFTGYLDNTMIPKKMEKILKFK